MAHIFILHQISQYQSHKTISAELLSLPTNVTIRFLTPPNMTSKAQSKLQAQPKVEPPKIQPKPEPKLKSVKKRPVEKVKKPTVKKAVITKPKITNNEVAKVVTPKTINNPSPVQLNKIEPAAAVATMPTIARSQPSAPALVPAPVVTPSAVANTPKAIPVVSDKSLKGRRVQPKYPDRALRMKQEGTVWLHVLISETGARQDIKVHQPTKYALLNQAAVKAVKKWTFSPNLVNGKATKSWVEIPIEFKIQ